MPKGGFGCLKLTNLSSLRHKETDIRFFSGNLGPLGQLSDPEVRRLYSFSVLTLVSFDSIVLSEFLVMSS